MLQIDNQTPFYAVMSVLPDGDGIDTLYVVIKATLLLRPKLTLAPVQLPVTLADEYHGDPADSSLKQVSELHIGKLGTDVLLAGRAWAPEGQLVAASWVRLAVAERQKTIRVLGDRSWREDGTPTAPEPFEAMPLVWERAFGGFEEERNPVGVGFVGKRATAELVGHPVPNLEDPTTPLEQLGQVCKPACLAPSASHWLPRRAFGGTYDERWQRTRAPFLPVDFDRRFFSCAAAEMAFDRYLQGGEPVEVRGVTPDGLLSFTLPPAYLEVEVKVGSAIERPVANLETVFLEPDENRLCLTWRAALPCDRKVLKIDRVTVTRRRAGASE